MARRRRKKYEKNKETSFVFWFGSSIILVIGLGFFLGAGYIYTIACQVYQMKCAHSVGYCEISRYDLSKQDYVLKHKVPINIIEKMYLDKKERRQDGEKVYVSRLILKTTKGFYFLDAMDTNIGSSEKNDEILLFKNWKDGQGKNLYIYQETSANAHFLLMFVCIGAFLLFLFLLLVFFRIRYVIRKKYQSVKTDSHTMMSKHSNNVIERI